MKRRKYKKLIDTKHFNCDVLTFWWIIGFGISTGSHSFKENKPVNLFIEVEFLFWVFSLEVK